jgi:hypothetical protein
MSSENNRALVLLSVLGFCYSLSVQIEAGIPQPAVAHRRAETPPLPRPVVAQDSFTKRKAKVEIDEVKVAERQVARLAAAQTTDAEDSKPLPSRTQALVSAGP